MNEPRLNEIERRLERLEVLVEALVERLAQEAEELGQSRGSLEALHSRFKTRLKGGR